MSELKVGTQAPEFRLKSHRGGEVSLSDFKGKKSVVLFFYPKDETIGCTKEACSFRDEYDHFTEAGAEVIGISSDSIESHVGFAQNHRLPMTLLSDPGGRVRARYGAEGSLFGILPGRVTFVIDRGGIIRHKFSSQLRFLQHVQEALGILRSIDAEAKSAGKSADAT